MWIVSDSDDDDDDDDNNCKKMKQSKKWSNLGSDWELLNDK